MTHTPIDSTELLAEGRALRALARRLAGGADTADDLLQEGALAAVRAGRSTRASPWLFGTLRNLARMLRRGDRRRIEREQRTLTTAATPDDPATIVQQAELARDIASAVACLEEPFRTVVVLRFWRDLSPDLIAQQLGIPKNTVRSRLHRGLDRLRATLDAKHGSRSAWLLPLSAFTSVDGVGTAALEATTDATPIAAATLQPAVLGLAMLALTFAVSLPWTLALATVAEPVAAGTAPTIAAATGPEDRTNEMPALRVDAAAPQPPSLAEPTPTPSSSTRWAARFHVVDTQGRPLERATVALREFGVGTWPRDANASEAAPQVVHTDARGDASILLTGEGYTVVAEAADVGLSGAGQGVWRGQKDEPLLLVVRPPLVLRGRVLDEQGSPLPDVAIDVKTMPSTALPLLHAREVPPIRCDAHGAFAMPVQRQVSYELTARHGDRQSFRESIHVVGPPPEVELTFPGAITIAGTVVDPAGAPVAGAEVTAWRDRPADAHENGYRDHEVVTGRCDANGRYSLAVRRHAHFRLLASAKDHATSDLVRIETSPTRPHIEQRLDMVSFASIQGRVTGPDGAPMPGLRVFARPEGSDDMLQAQVPGGPVPNLVDRFPKVPTQVTQPNGAFALRVHPGTSWIVEVRLDPTQWRRRVLVHGVAPGRTDVHVEVRAADLAECIVTGTVHASPPPTDGYKVWIVDCEEDGKTVGGSSEASETWDGDRFTCRPLPRHRWFVLRIEPTEPKSVLAPAFVGPFRTDGERLELEVRLTPWGKVPVRVLQADGSPALLTRVNWISDNTLVGFRDPVHVRLDGRATVGPYPPGKGTLCVVDDERCVHRQELLVAPGLNPERVVTLPR